MKWHLRPQTAERVFWISGWFYDFSKLATVILVIGLIAHYFLMTVLVVKGNSMEPNFVDGQVLLVNKLTYLIDTPQRGEVVAMFFPGETEKRFIKRVVGLPGEVITIQDGHVLINGIALEEEYLPQGLTTSPNISRTLNIGEYFVLGDNRLVSSDSRSWGTVPRSFIIGRVTAQIWSPE